MGFTNKYTLENEGSSSAKLRSKRLGPQRHKYLNFLERRIKQNFLRKQDALGTFSKSHLGSMISRANCRYSISGINKSKRLVLGQTPTSGWAG